MSHHQLRGTTPSGFDEGQILKDRTLYTDEDGKVPTYDLLKQDIDDQWPLAEDNIVVATKDKDEVEAQSHDGAVATKEEDETDDGSHGRTLASGSCSIFAEGKYFNLADDTCYNLGGTWWNDKITYITSSSNTCINIYEHHDGGQNQQYCGEDWLQLGTMSQIGSRVCCPVKRASASETNPLTNTCTGNGGACGCGKGGDNNLMTLNRFFGDNNDEKIWGCGGAFKLAGATWNSQWGGSLSAGGPEANVLHSVGVDFKQDASYDGWEGKSNSDPLTPLMFFLNAGWNSSYFHIILMPNRLLQHLWSKSSDGRKNI